MVTPAFETGDDAMAFVEGPPREGLWLVSGSHEGESLLFAGSPTDRGRKNEVVLEETTSKRLERRTPMRALTLATTTDGKLVAYFDLLGTMYFVRGVHVADLDEIRYVYARGTSAFSREKVTELPRAGDDVLYSGVWRGFDPSATGPRWEPGWEVRRILGIHEGRPEGGSWLIDGHSFTILHERGPGLEAYEKRTGKVGLERPPIVVAPLIQLIEGGSSGVVLPITSVRNLWGASEEMFVVFEEAGDFEPPVDPGLSKILDLVQPDADGENLLELPEDVRREEWDVRDPRGMSLRYAPIAARFEPRFAPPRRLRVEEERAPVSDLPKENFPPHRSIRI